MNSEDKQIDIIFKEGFSKQKFQIPDEYKSDLKKRLAKRKKGIILFWFSVIGVSLTVLFSLFHLSTKNSHESYASNIPLQSEIPSPKENKALVKIKNVKSNNKINIKPLNKDEKKINEVKSSKENKLKNHTTTFKHKENVQEKYRNDSQLKNVLSITKQKENLNLINNGTGDTPFKSFNNDKIKPYDFIGYLPLKNLNLESNLVNEILINNHKNGSIDAIQNKLKKERAVNLLLSFGIISSFNKVKYLGNESEYYATNTKEKSTINYEFNANILVKNNFIFGTGIGMSQHKFNYNFNTVSLGIDTTITLDSTYVFEYYIYQQNTIVDSVYHYTYNNITSIDTTVNTSNYSNTTISKYFSIPLNIGYNINYNKFMFNIIFSINYNRLYDVEGGYYSNNSFELINKSNNTIFKNSYFSYHFRANISYNLFKNFYINSSFGFSPYSSNLVNDPNLERKIQRMDLGIGLMYKL